MPPSPPRFALTSSRIVTPTGVRGGAIVIADGKIEAIVKHDEIPTGVPTEDLGGLVISPGLIDAHVHINEPGRTEWEGFETATRAAAAGGVTTLVDMPLNSSPVTTTVAALEEKRTAATGKCWVDVAFHGGLVPGNLEHIEPLIDAGVCGIKAFMCDSGLPEFPASGEQELREAGAILARRDVPLLVHAEVVNEFSPQVHPTDFSSWVASRPDSWEVEALRMLRHVAEDSGVRVHVVHLSSKAGARFIESAQRHGHHITAETCPHYLYFGEEHFASATTLLKCLRRRFVAPMTATR